MDVQRRISELEEELSRLRAAARGDGSANAADAIVARLVASHELLAQLPDVIAVLDRGHRILYLSRTVVGRSPSEYVGEDLLGHLVESERESRRAALERAWETGEPQTIESRSSSGFVWENRIVPIADSGTTVAVLTTSIDITARKRVEDALRASASTLRHALDATGLGTWTRDASGVRWDETLCGILGIPVGSGSTNPDDFFAFIHPDDREVARGVAATARTTGRFDELACRILRPDGTIRHVLVNATIEFGDDGTLARSFGGILDVTERHQLEERLRHAEKMDAIGHLTAGIAHNFNNILGVILPNVELARRLTADKIAQRLEHIQQAAERGADMVRQLMLFARSDASARMEPTDLVACAERTVAICRSTFDAAIRIDLIAEPGLPNVIGNAGQLQQVLLNVCLNARDALTDAGTKTPRIEVLLERTETDAVLVSVRDNGPGMDEATRGRIFDPFFTTKDAQHGTGLGLPSVLAIVTDHRGTVRCESQPGEGTTIRIELPATTESVRPDVVPDTKAKAPRGTETVLLADDEPLVRNATRSLLERGGYDVLEAQNGAETLATFAEHRARIAAVILDRSMPELSGEKVLGELALAAPEVPVVMLSGHLGGDEDWSSASAVLTKPTDEATLLATIRAVIDRSPRFET